MGAQLEEVAKVMAGLDKNTMTSHCSRRLGYDISKRFPITDSIFNEDWPGSKRYPVPSGALAVAYYVKHVEGVSSFEEAHKKAQSYEKYLMGSEVPTEEGQGKDIARFLAGFSDGQKDSPCNIECAATECPYKKGVEVKKEPEKSRDPWHTLGRIRIP